MEPYDQGNVDAIFSDISNGETDLGALSIEQQLKLNQLKIKTRLNNESYLRKHPEVSIMLSGFLSSCLSVRPDSVERFASEYFSDPQLYEKVKSRLKNKTQEQLKDGHLRSSYSEK